MRNHYWECDNCQGKRFQKDFPSEWIHLRSILVSEGTYSCATFVRPPFPSNTFQVQNPDLSLYLKENDKTFCGVDCYLKYLSKMFQKGDNFNPSMKVS